MTRQMPVADIVVPDGRRTLRPTASLRARRAREQRALRARTWAEHWWAL